MITSGDECDLSLVTHCGVLVTAFLAPKASSLLARSESCFAVFAFTSHLPETAQRHGDLIVCTLMDHHHLSMSASETFLENQQCNSLIETWHWFLWS